MPLPDTSPHVELIQQAAPKWLLNTSKARAKALSSTALAIQPWYSTAAAELKHANAQAWTTQNTVDQQLSALQDLPAFAEPLLRGALKTHYQVDVDVRQTYLFLVSAKGQILPGATSRSVSLLDAALHNFSSSERFSDASDYISQPDARGHFTVLKLKPRISIAQFTALCRRLDIGAQYQRHLKRHLLQTTLKASVIANQKAALHAAAHMALAQQHITPASFHLLQRTLKGERGVMQFYRLGMMNTSLSGILLIAADLDTAREAVNLLAYIPHDPHTPVKEHANTVALMNDLTTRLRDADYRRFFSQFVDQQQRGHFFSGLAQRLSTVKWHRKDDVTDPRPTWRDTPVDSPILQYHVTRIDGDLWTRRYQQALNKILNDARELAVSTADCDSHARWRWWDNVSKMLSEIFDAALLVVTPFVPLLGEAMLAYTAYQLLDEVVEGVVDLAEGQALEAAQHLVGVVSSVVQLGAFAAAGKILPSLFVNQLKPVWVKGRQRLWNPDLKPYVHHDLTPDSSPDRLGLHTQQGRTILPLDNAHYRVEQHPVEGDYRILHPRRSDAYAPRLQHNGQGAWSHEAENPRAWDEAKLLRRLGHSVSDLSDTQLAQVSRNSGTEPEHLCAMHTEHSPPPPLLQDSLHRLRLNQQALTLAQNIRTGVAADEETYWSPAMALELPGWPASHRINVFQEPSLTGTATEFGDPGASKVLAISHQDLNKGLLPERLVDFLDDNTLPEPRAQRIEALRNRLADNLAQRQPDVFDYLYENSQASGSVPGEVIRASFPEVPTPLVRSLLEQARPDEIEHITAQQHLPLRVKNLARAMALDARASHAHEGLYATQAITPDTERLMLNTLKLHSDAFGRTRVEIRQHSRVGKLRCQAGPEQAGRVRVLVRDEHAQYRVHDHDGNLLTAPGDLYSALLQSLPEVNQRAFTDGAQLRDWLMDRLASLEPRRMLLDEPMQAPLGENLIPLQRFRWVSRMLGVTPPTVEDRVRALYPHLRAEQVNARAQTFSTPEGRLVLQDLERQKKTLVDDLDHWVKAPTDFHDGDAERRQTERMVRSLLSRALQRSWETSGGGYIDDLGERQVGSRLDLEGWPLGPNLLRMPTLRSNFGHITSLAMPNTALTDANVPFLQLFPNLLSLDLTHNHLTQLPPALANLPRLTQLDIGSNPLRWDAAQLEQVKNLSQLKTLDLSHNRNLTTAPDVSGMRDLRELYLGNTAIADWPNGLFEHPRPRGFVLDMQNAPVHDVPQFLPWQPEADLVARTRLDRNQLGLDAEERMVSYRLEVGLDPYRTYPPRGAQDSFFWLQGFDARERIWRQNQWNDLEQEHGSQGFFEVIRSLQLPEQVETERDRDAFIANRTGLSANVWRMLDAMHQDEGLRREFFRMAGTPGNCADASAQIFNNLGVETLVYETYRRRAQLSADTFAAHLAHLARQKARLDHVNRLAEAEVKRRLAPTGRGGLGLRLSTEVLDGVRGTVDEVQVHLAYQTALKQRLDLPWLAEHMVYRATADVSANLLDSAHQQIISAEQGDGLLDQMLDVPFWDDYLDATHGDELQRNAERFQEKAGMVDDLQQIQDTLANKPQAPEEEKVALRQTLKNLADSLGIPHSEVLTGAPMTDATYTRLLQNLAVEQKALRRQLTRRALAMADLTI